MQIIKQQITASMRHNSKALYRLSYEFDKSTNTINRWLELNDQGEVTPLTTPMGINAISEEMEIPKNELLTETN